MKMMEKIFELPILILNTLQQQQQLLTVLGPILKCNTNLEIKKVI